MVGDRGRSLHGDLSPQRRATVEGTSVHETALPLRGGSAKAWASAAAIRSRATPAPRSRRAATGGVRRPVREGLYAPHPGDGAILCSAPPARASGFPKARPASPRFAPGSPGTSRGRIELFELRARGVRCFASACARIVGVCRSREAASGPEKLACRLHASERGPSHGVGRARESTLGGPPANDVARRVRRGSSPRADRRELASARIPHASGATKRAPPDGTPSGCIARTAFTRRATLAASAHRSPRVRVTRNRIVFVGRQEVGRGSR